MNLATCLSAVSNVFVIPHVPSCPLFLLSKVRSGILRAQIVWSTLVWWGINPRKSFLHVLESWRVILIPFEISYRKSYLFQLDQSNFLIIPKWIKISTVLKINFKVAWIVGSWWHMWLHLLLYPKIKLFVTHPPLTAFQLLPITKITCQWVVGVPENV